MANQRPQVTKIRFKNADKAIIFLHGFSGNRDETWEKFPSYIGTLVSDWDIFTLGYETSFQPDILGVWAADPDLPILAHMFRTKMSVSPFIDYTKLAIVAHSMGGLIIQKAIVDDDSLRQRLEHLFMFGTPSGGLRKASWVKFWKRQLRNMSQGSDFIFGLRQKWNSEIGASPNFCLQVIAGTKDQFVPPESSLRPFDDKFCFVVPGNHLDIVNPENTDAESVAFVAHRLIHGCQDKDKPKSQDTLRLASELPPADISSLIESRVEILTESEVVDAALALDRSGKRHESIALLEHYRSIGTDVQGTLAGRIKRLWLESESEEDAKHAMTLYQNALKQALSDNDHEQIYYLAINVAFFALVVFKDTEMAKKHALLSLERCAKSKPAYWNTATQAEAHIYLGDLDKALELYSQVVKEKGCQQQWKLESTSLQASVLASHLKNRDFAEELEKLFSPHAIEVNKIFLSYSHKDIEWMKRLETMLKPYLREAEQELNLWVDTKIRAGDQWSKQIDQALKSASIAVLLVSADFLASEFITKVELSWFLKVAKEGKLRLLWVYLSPAGYEATDLKYFQATHDIKTPLSLMDKPLADQTLKEIAIKIKKAGLAIEENEG